MHVTFGEGYTADVTLTWHTVALVDQAALGCGAPSGPNVITKAVVANGTVNYPVVNGIAPPPAMQMSLVADSVPAFGTQLECSSVGYGPGSYHQLMKMPTVSDVASGNGDFNLVLGDVSEKTPNNPHGVFAGSYKDVEMTFNAATKCTFEGPGVQANKTFPEQCVVSVPK